MRKALLILLAILIIPVAYSAWWTQEQIDSINVTAINMSHLQCEGRWDWYKEGAYLLQNYTCLTIEKHSENPERPYHIYRQTFLGGERILTIREWIQQGGRTWATQQYKRTIINQVYSYLTAIKQQIEDWQTQPDITLDHPGGDILE